MPLRRDPGPPDLTRVVAVLGGPPPGASPEPVRPAGRAPSPSSQVSSGWVPAAPVSQAGGSSGARSPVKDETTEFETSLRMATRPRLLTVPESLRTGRLAVSSAAVVAMLALVLALGSAFVLRVLWAERSAGADLEPETAATVGVSVERPAGVASTGGTSTSTAGGTGVPAQLVVHVVGQVRRPGLVRLGPGARVADAITAAGGATTTADLSALNLARLVVDGEQVLVPRPGEAGLTGGTAVGQKEAGAAGATPGGLVNLNTADLTELDTLPGVGPVLAQRIFDWRAEHGRFTSVDELGEITGIGEKLYAQIRPKVTL